MRTIIINPEEEYLSLGDLNRWLNTARKKRIKIIEPSAIAKSLNLPISKILNLLDDMVENHILRKKWVILCPECRTPVKESTKDPHGTINSLQCDCCDVEILVRNAKIQIKYEII